MQCSLLSHAFLSTYAFAMPFFSSFEFSPRLIYAHPPWVSVSPHRIMAAPRLLSDLACILYRGLHFSLDELISLFGFRCNMFISLASAVFD